MMVFLLFGDSLFFMRQLLGRPFTLLTALCLLVVWAVLRRRWLVLLVLLALATLLSQLFIFPLFIAGVGSVWLWRSKRTSSVLCAGASVAGTSAGLALHPQPLEYLRYLAMGFFGTLVPFSGSGVDGSEVHSGFSKNALHVILGIGIVCVLLLPILLQRQMTREMSTEGPA
jgi:4-amino-4-deoxy-L-arabinose transferase-like glycosyltransferase